MIETTYRQTNKHISQQGTHRQADIIMNNQIYMYKNQYIEGC